MEKLHPCVFPGNNRTKTVARTIYQISHADALLYVINVYFFYFLKSIVRKLKEDGVSYADIQKQGNLAYQQLSSEEKQKYETMATTANENLTSSSGKLSKEKMIKRITNNIESNVSFTATNALDYGPYAIFLLFFNFIYVDETAG